MALFDREPEQILEDDAFVKHVARELLLDEHRAADLAQDAWLVGAATTPPEGRTRGWLAGIARNLAWRGIQRDARRLKRERAGARVDAVPSTAEILERESLRRAIVRTVLELDEPYRSTIILRFLEELPPRVVARRLDVPVETVRSRLRRGTEKLRERLGRDHGGDALALGLMMMPFVAGTGFGAITTAALSPFMKPATELLAVSMKTKITCGGLAAVLLCVVAWNALSDDAPEPIGGSAATLNADEDDRIAPRRRGAPDAPVDEAAAEEIEPEITDVAEGEAEAPLPAPDVGPLLVRTVWKDTGEALPNIPVNLHAWGGSNPYADALLFVTGDDGTARLEGLPVGRISLDSVTGGIARGEVTGDSAAEAVLEIERGYEVHGLVVDGDGRPVPGADIHLGDIGDDGCAVTTSDAAGRFHLPAAKAGSWVCVGARKAGYVASPFVILLGKKDTEHNVRLVLRAGGTRMRGRVVRPDGQPAAGARVELDYGFGDQFTRDDGTRARTPSGHRTVTDEKGRFALEGLHSGDAKLIVRLAPFAPHSRDVKIAEDRRDNVLVTLLEGVTVRGEVVTRGGAPVAEATLMVGEYGLAGAFARTGQDGRFEIEGLAPGRIEIRVRTDKRGKTSDSFVAESGETVERSIVLAAGARIKVRILGPVGEPLAGWSISGLSFSKGVMSRESAISDASGHAILEGLEPDQRVAVSVHHKESHGEIRVLRDVTPSEDWVEFRLEAEELELARLMGIVVSPDGEPLANIRLSPYRKGANNSGIELTDANGRFDLELAAGDYTLIVTPPGYAQVRRRLTLVGGQEEDVGEIRTVVGGNVEVVFEGTPPTDVKLHVLLESTADTGDRQWLTLGGEPSRSRMLPPGTWTATFEREGRDDEVKEFEIVAGATTRLTF